MVKNEKKEQPFESFFNLNTEYQDSDVVLLEALIKSPAWAALRRALDVYRRQCESVLHTSAETHKLFQTQGRIMGIKVVEELPGMLVSRRELQEKRKQQDAEKRVVKPEWINK